MVLFFSIFLFNFILFSLIIFLTREYPLEWRPDDEIPTIISFSFNFGLAMETPLLTPTQNPARSYLSFESTSGCSAVSPPSSERIRLFYIPLNNTPYNFFTL